MEEHRARMMARYQRGDRLPWDDDAPPPEVHALAAKLRPGRALDLGCGYGRTAIYLAQQGWEVDAIDFIDEAVIEARRRAAAAGVAPRFHTADVSDLGFLRAPYTLAIDVGCAHGLDPLALRAYCAGLARLLASGADYLLYARLREPLDSDDSVQAGPPGFSVAGLYEVLGDQFALLKRDEGERSTFHAPWQSAWFHFRRSR